MSNIGRAFPVGSQNRCNFPGTQSRAPCCMEVGAAGFPLARNLGLRIRQESIQSQDLESYKDESNSDNYPDPGVAFNSRVGNCFSPLQQGKQQDESPNANYLHPDDLVPSDQLQPQAPIVS
jgi:hypothetical protein